MYIVYAWNNRSENSYYFGPFPTEETALAFCEKMPEGYSPDADVMCLNSPELSGTGQELS